MLLARLLGHSRPSARERAAELLEAFGLSESADKQVKTYSGGMQRRLDIAASIIVTPDLRLFLDEPTTGLDSRSRNQVWDIVRILVAEGTTVLTTQYLDEADQLADRISVIDHGKVIAEGTSGELKASVGSGALHVRVGDPRSGPRPSRCSPPGRAGAARVRPGRTLRHRGRRRRGPGAQRLAEAGVSLSEFALGQPSLDEVFLSLTGHPAEDGGEVATAGAPSPRRRRWHDHHDPSTPALAAAVD